MYQIGNIVKGINAGTFVVTGHTQVGEETWNRLTEVEPTNHSNRKPGGIALPDECLTFVQAKQCHYFTWINGMGEGRWLAHLEDFAECNPGHPIEIYGTWLAVVFDSAKGDHRWLLRHADGTHFEVGYGFGLARLRRHVAAMNGEVR